MSDEPPTYSEDAEGPVRTWGGLQILEEIGSGGFGRVYRAWESALARDVALKIIRPRDPRPETLQAILREGQLLARVRHSNVVTIFGAQQIGDEVGLWMEFIRGRSLAQIVKDDGPRAAPEAAVIGVAVCQALSAVHKAGVIHRDIKAHNVMREAASGRIVLMDFGAGQALDGPRQEREGLVGTLPYMAPEVLGGARASERSDVYSLGVLLYFLVSGTYPVEGRSTTDFLLAHSRLERRSLADLRPDISPAFVHVVDRATAMRPGERYASPGAMLQDLSYFATGHFVQPSPVVEPAAPVPLPPRPRRTWWRIPAMIAGGVAGLWILGGITSIAFNHTLVRGAEYRGESILSWPMWGARALLAPTVKVLAVFLVWTLVRAVMKVLTHASKPASDISDSIRSRRHALATRLGLDDGESAANALLATEILAVGAFCWYFRDILGAVMTFIDEAPPQALEPLHPRHLLRHQYYDFTMGLLILGMIMGTRRLNDMRRRFGGALHSSLVLSGVVLAAAFAILVVPYRLLWQSGFETATYQERTCYVLGEKSAGAGPSILVYCPDDPERKVQEVAPRDVTKHGERKEIFCLGDRSCPEEVP